MRIGVMAPPWMPVPPPGYGGTEAVVDRLARGLVEAGQDVLLWTTGDSTCPVPTGHVFDHAQSNDIGIAAIELRHLIHGYEAFAEWGADIVHDHTVIGPVFGKLHPELAAVTTNHGPFDEILNDLYRAIADKVPIIAISHDQASRARGFEVATVIHHGIDLDSFTMGDGSGDEYGPYVLFLGRMSPEKGARRAILAAREAGVRLLIAAKMREPLEHQFFRELIQPLLDDDIVYVGEATNEERLRLLRGATALVNPIRWPEPFGLVMIEALACGTPVVAYREGSAPELIDHGTTGFLCDSISEIAQHLIGVGSIDRATCRAVAKERFGTDRMVNDHIDLYARVLAGRR
jgi:glycosyltransferase involved in cell wall biosynthesis